MKCSKCGKEIEEEARFCPFCGEKCEKEIAIPQPLSKDDPSEAGKKASIKNAVETSAIARKSRKKRICAILCIILLIVGGAVILRSQLHSYSSLGKWNVERSIEKMNVPSDVYDTRRLIDEVYPLETGVERFSAYLEADEKLRFLADSEETYQRYSELQSSITEALGNSDCKTDLRALGLKYKIAGNYLIACNENFSYYSNPLRIELCESGANRFVARYYDGNNDIEFDSIAELGYWDTPQQQGTTPKQYLETLSGGYLYVSTDKDDISSICFWAPDMTWQEIEKTKGELTLISLQSWGASSTGQLLYYFERESDEKIGKLCFVFLDGSGVGERGTISENADVSCGAALVREKLYFASPGGDFIGSHLKAYDPLDKSITPMSGKTDYVYEVNEISESSYWEDLAVLKLYGTNDSSRLFVRFAGIGDDEKFEWLTIYDISTGRDTMPCGESLISITGGGRDSGDHASLADFFDEEKLYHYHLNNETEGNQSYRLCSISEDGSSCHIVVDNIPTDIKEDASFDSDINCYKTFDWVIDNYILMCKTSFGISKGYHVFDLSNHKYKSIDGSFYCFDRGLGVLPYVNGSLFGSDNESPVFKYDLWKDPPTLGESFEGKLGGGYRNDLVDLYSDPFEVSFLFLDVSESDSGEYGNVYVYHIRY